jgi:hypothetical protein
VEARSERRKGQRENRGVGGGELHCASQCLKIACGNGPSRIVERLSSSLKRGERGFFEILVQQD